MSLPTHPAPMIPFDRIRHEDALGEYWLARELAPLLEYALWQNFQGVIKKAVKACEVSGQQVSANFIDITKVSSGGKHGNYPLRDYRLTRHACYLIAMNGDPGKEVIANAMAYFTVQTRRQELADSDPERGYLEWHENALRSYVAHGYTENWARMRVDAITTRNRLTGEWAVRGIDSQEFGVLTDKLHMGEFGISTEEHKEMKGFPVVRKGKRMVHQGELRDAMTEMELAVTQVGEIMARALHIARDSQGLQAISRDVDHAGTYAADRRQELIEATGQQIPSPINAIPSSNDLWGQLPSQSDLPKVAPPADGANNS